MVMTSAGASFCNGKEANGFACTANSCAPSGGMANSDHSGAGSITGVTGDTVAVTCDAGYSGGGDVTCGTAGTFSEDVTCAAPVSCQGPDGTVVDSGHSHTFTCPTGKVNAADSSTDKVTASCDDGNWDVDFTTSCADADGGGDEPEETATASTVGFASFDFESLQNPNPPDINSPDGGILKIALADALMACGQTPCSSYPDGECNIQVTDYSKAVGARRLDLSTTYTFSFLVTIVRHCDPNTVSCSHLDHQVWADISTMKINLATAVSTESDFDAAFAASIQQAIDGGVISADGASFFFYLQQAVADSTFVFVGDNEVTFSDVADAKGAKAEDDTKVVFAKAFFGCFGVVLIGSFVAYKIFGKNAAEGEHKTTVVKDGNGKLVVIGDNKL